MEPGIWVSAAATMLALNYVEYGSMLWNCDAAEDS